ncbi:cytochrome c oxidase assembly protein [Rhizobium cauense]|uniref:cytochrome c oxidase assembly protein n=1 Tax=Rhizobium cauense TaxID=1166683 RepID=UPI001C6E394F|nr:cytochrome c oxidase assembly protein [Rhizobium cauense]MBW9117694.1 cytochrome c oxidase assembly protein [Rhizobium cauense]
MKTTSLTVGLTILFFALVLLALTWSSGSLLAHMVVHMMIVAIAAPFLAVSISRSQVGSTIKPSWLGPLLASVLELLVVWFWHLPAARRWAETRADAVLVEQISFVGAGMILWLTCFRPLEEGGQRMAGVIGLLFTSIHMTLLGVLLTLSPRPLYGAGDITCLGIPLSRSVDQQLAGVVMLLIGAAAYLIGAVFLLAEVLKPESSERCR